MTSKQAKHRRAIAYIDGRNLHHGLNEYYNIDGFHYNYRGLVERYSKGRNLTQIKYYGAIYPREVDTAKHNRDDAFYKHLEAEQDITFIKGAFKVSEIKGAKVPREKGVDVRLATDLIFDAVYNLYDDAYVFSADTDILPAIEQIKKKFPDRKIYNPTLVHSKEFKDKTDGSFLIRKNVAKKFIHNDFKPTTATLEDFQKNFGKKL